MAKKSLLGNIIGAPKDGLSDTTSQGVKTNLGKNNEPNKEINSGEPPPTVPIVAETPTKEPIVAVKPIETPIVEDKAKVTPIVQVKPAETPIAEETPIKQDILIMKNPVKKEPIENKSIRIAPEEMQYIDQLVKHKRMSGYTNYTKKEALSEALALLMDKYPVDKLLTEPYR